MIPKSFVQRVAKLNPFRNSFDLSKRYLHYYPARYEIEKVQFSASPLVLRQRSYLTFPPFINPQDESDVSLQFQVSNVPYTQQYPSVLGFFDKVAAPTPKSQPFREIHIDASNFSGAAAQTSPSSDIKCSIVPRNSSKNISRFLIKHFNNSEPMMRALGMDLSQIAGWFKRFIRESLFASDINVSVEAIDWDAKLRIGVLSSKVVDPRKRTPLLHEFDELDPDKLSHPLYAEITEFYRKLQEGLDFTNMGGVKPTKVLEHWYMCVHPNYGGKGIGNQMLKLSETLASMSNGCRLGCAVATSEFSYKVLTKNGYKVAKEMKYADYVNSKGVRLFEGKEEQLKPHESVRAMVKEFPDLYNN